MISLSNFKAYRKSKGGIWYKHQFTLAAVQIMLVPGNTFWARYPWLNRYTEIIDTEKYFYNEKY